jgi:hypothetical protein
MDSNTVVETVRLAATNILSQAGTNTASQTAQLNPFDLLAQVNSFYDTAWQRLLIFFSFVAGVVGVVVPILLQFYQRAAFRRDEKAIDEKIKQLVEAGKLSLKKDLGSDLDSHRKTFSDLISQYDEKIAASITSIKQEQSENQAKMRDEFAKQNSRTEGMSFFVQGALLQSQENYILASGSFINASEGLLAADDHANLRRALDRLKDCLKNIKKSDIETHDEIKPNFDSLIDELKKQNQTGQFSDIIRVINKEFKAASERQSSPK